MIRDDFVIESRHIGDSIYSIGDRNVSGYLMRFLSDEEFMKLFNSTNTIVW